MQTVPRQDSCQHDLEVPEFKGKEAEEEVTQILVVET